jgi:hypothetical protein
MYYTVPTELPTTYRYAVLMSMYILWKGLQYTVLALLYLFFIHTVGIEGPGFRCMP